MSTERITDISAIRTWLMTCPSFGGAAPNVDWLDPDKGEYSIEAEPTTPVEKTYLDGSTIRKLDFTIASRAYYGNYTTEQINNLKFFEELQAWLESQAKARNFPTLDTGKTPRKLEISTAGHLYQTADGTARYQMQCRLTYYQRGTR